jgi:hypothetical protein
MSFAPRGAPCGDDPDDTARRKGEDHEQQTARTGHADGPEAVLIDRVGRIREHEAMRVQENVLDLGERHSVLREVHASLVRIPPYPIPQPSREAEAADWATIVEAVVEAAISGERPDWSALGVSQAERVAAASAGSSMGLLGDLLDLLARANRGLGAIETERVIEVPSKSRPGEVNRVRISTGVATCSCKGFEYRGDCSHAREAARLAAA